MDHGHAVLQNAWSSINSLDWKDESFDLAKAHLCLAFSELAYRHVPEFEIGEGRRYKVVPSYAYQKIVHERRPSDVGAYLRDLDFGDFFIIARRYIIVVGIRTTKALFVAIRGTKDLYDWRINLTARMHRLQEIASEPRFHRGFYRAAASAFGPVAEAIHSKKYQPGIPIYFAGHSLGGALAAIFHAVWWRSPYHVPYCGIDPLELELRYYRMRSTACYTFGMPRYGDLAAVTLRQPFHIYNHQDIVPSVPPRWLGFEDPLSEYSLSARALELRRGRDAVRFASWVSRLALGKGVAEHAVEIYRNNLRAVTPPLPAP